MFGIDRTPNAADDERMEVLGHDAVALLMDALTSLDVQTLSPAVRDAESDIVLADGTSLWVKRLSLVTPDVAQRSLGSAGDATLMVVGDRVTAAARRVLKARGAGYYDLRGHLVLTTPSLRIDTDVEPVIARPERRDPLSGRAGLEVATHLLINPDTAPSVRELARQLHRSPSTVSEVLAALKRQDLLASDGRVTDAQLFWRVADRWPGERTHLAEVPDPGGTSRTSGPLRLGLGAEGTGWALADSAAAAALGAPLAFSQGQPLDFFVPDATTVRRARSLLGGSTGRATARCSLRVAPVPAVCAQRVNLPSNPFVWPLTHPVFAALDLAQDAGRGHEVLEAWTPDGTWRRVW